MPSGGLQMFGAGLQLQQVTPGTANTGNANITGTMIAGVFTNNDPNLNEIFGRVLSHPNSAYSVLMGYGVQALSISSNFNVIVGYGAYDSGGGGSVCIGALAGVGSSVDVSGGDMSIGYNARAVRSGFNSNMSIGSGVQANSCANVLTIAQGADGAVLTGRTSVIAIGRGAAALVTGDAQIRIGDSSYSGGVSIGPFQIGASTGSTARIANANYTILPTIGTVQMTAITAPRVWTLPSAAAVPAGYIVRTSDFSGAVTGVNNITVNPAGTDTIVGPGSPNINAAYGSGRFMSDGVSKWLCANNF